MCVGLQRQYHGLNTTSALIEGTAIQLPRGASTASGGATAVANGSCLSASAIQLPMRHASMVVDEEEQEDDDDNISVSDTDRRFGPLSQAQVVVIVNGQRFRWEHGALVPR